MIFMNDFGYMQSIKQFADDPLFVGCTIRLSNCLYIISEALTDDLPSVDCTCPKCLLLHSKVLAWINKLAKLYNIIVCTIYKFRFSNFIKVRWQIQSPQLTCMHSHEMNVLSRKGTKHNTTQERVCGNYKKVTQAQTKSFIGDSCIDPSQTETQRPNTPRTSYNQCLF